MKHNPRYTQEFNRVMQKQKTYNNGNDQNNHWPQHTVDTQQLIIQQLSTRIIRYNNETHANTTMKELLYAVLITHNIYDN